MPSPQAVKEFKDLYLRRYGVLLSDAEAFAQAIRLLSLYKAVYKPDDEPGAGADHEAEIQP